MTKKLAEKLPFHYSWVILFTCCLLFGSAMGLLNNCAGLYTAGLAEDNNWPLTYMTLLWIPCTASAAHSFCISP